jgi:hypothetical protein
MLQLEGNRLTELKSKLMFDDVQCKNDGGLDLE